MRESWESFLRELSSGLSHSVCSGAEGGEIAMQEAFLQWLVLALDVLRTRRTVYLIGNGASASMASHFAADLAKNGGLKTHTFSDLSLITAVANDISYEAVFSEPLRRCGEEGDLLVAISSSGMSPNIIAGVKEGLGHGMHVVTLSAKANDNTLRRLGRLNFFVPVMTYGLAETAHAAILHHWMDLVQAAVND
jgi:D-sedoheptulose 7-phosphate isomerase